MKNVLLVIHQGYTDIIVCLGMMYYYSTYYNLTIIIREDLKDFLEIIFKNINIKFLFFPFEKVKFTNIKLLINQLLEKKIIIIDEFLYHGCAVSPISHGSELICNANYFYNVFTNNRLDKNIAYKYFNINRNFILEQNRYDKLINDIGHNYIIINQSNDRLNKPYIKSEINPKFFINKNLPVFNLSDSSNIIIDMIKIIEKAKEIHLTSTFWSVIIYYLQLKYNLFNNIPIFLHSYTIPDRVINKNNNAKFDKSIYCEFGTTWNILNNNI